MKNKRFNKIRDRIKGKEDLVFDGDKLRFCDHNISKLNSFSYSKHFNSWNDFLFPMIPPNIKQISIEIIRLILFVVQIIIPLFWILKLYESHNEVKKAKIRMKQMQND